MGRRRGTSAFPVARIKKMMQSDDDVGKIATVTPVLVAKSLELMMQYVLEEAANIAIQRNTKTVTPQHLKTCVMNNDSFDFLRDTLKAVQPLEEEKKKRGKRPRSPATEGRKVRRVRSQRKTHTPVQEDVKEHPAEREIDVKPMMVEPVEEHVAVVGKANVEEEEDYDDDDAEAENDASHQHALSSEHFKSATTMDGEDEYDDDAETNAQSHVEQSQNGRMSVSALLS